MGALSLFFSVGFCSCVPVCSSQLVLSVRAFLCEIGVHRWLQLGSAHPRPSLGLVELVSGDKGSLLYVCTLHIQKLKACSDWR